MTSDQWYISKNGERQGPFSASQLRQMATAGQFSPSDFLWKQGMANWAPGTAVKGLFAETGPVATPRQQTPSPQANATPQLDSPLVAQLSQQPGQPTVFCTQCGAQMGMADSACARCGWKVPRKPTPGDDPGMRMLLPVGRSPLAIVSGYLGLISILLIPAPFALLTGILAMMDIKKHPEKHGMGRAIFGMVMGGLFSLALLMVFLTMLSQSLAPRPR